MIKTKKLSFLNKVLICFLSLLLCCVGGVIFSLSSAKAEEEKVSKINININFTPYESAFPKGVVGKFYQIFPATALDNLGNDVIVETVVTDPDKNVLPINDNCFATSKVGEYVIQYSAVSNGISDVEIVKVQVLDSCEELEYEISNEIPTEVDTGLIVYLYDGVVNGGVGEKKVNISVSLGNENIPIITNGNYKYFKPIKGGTYLFTAKVVDFVGNEKIVTKEIVVSDSDTPILSTPSISLTNKLNEKVTLPVADAILYRDGNVYHVPVKVTYDGEDVTSTMSYVADEVGEHTIKYIAENAFDSQATPAVKSFTVKTVDFSNNDIYAANYFSLDNFEGTYPEKAPGYLLSVKETGDASFQFKSAIYNEFAGAEIALDSNSAVNFNTFEFTFADSIYGDDKVTLSLGESNEKINIINNGKVCWTSANDDLYSKFVEGISLKYDYVNDTFVDKDNNVILNIKTYDDGRFFDGFKSGYVYVSCRAVNATTDTTFVVKSIGTNNITSATSDRIAPLFYDSEEIQSGIIADIGEVVTLKCPKAYDLFENEKVNYSIKILFNDEVIYDEKVSEYQLTVDQYGEYRVEFYAKDSRNSQRLITFISVADRIAPKLEIDGKIKEKVKVGAEIKLPTYTFTDNVSGQEQCLGYVYVSYGNFRKKLVYETYKFEEAGTYVFTYTVWDGATNYTTREFVVTCK